MGSSGQRSTSTAAGGDVPLGYWSSTKPLTTAQTQAALNRYTIPWAPRAPLQGEGTQNGLTVALCSVHHGFVGLSGSGSMFHSLVTLSSGLPPQEESFATHINESVSPYLRLRARVHTSHNAMALESRLVHAFGCEAMGDASVNKLNMTAHDRVLVTITLCHAFGIGAPPPYGAEPHSEEKILHTNT
eukprot:3230250-Amphidinium_carterae.1